MNDIGDVHRLREYKLSELSLKLAIERPNMSKRFLQINIPHHNYTQNLTAFIPSNRMRHFRLPSMMSPRTSKPPLSQLLEAY